MLVYSLRLSMHVLTHNNIQHDHIKLVYCSDGKITVIVYDYHLLVLVFWPITTADDHMYGFLFYLHMNKNKPFTTAISNNMLSMIVNTVATCQDHALSNMLTLCTIKNVLIEDLSQV